MQLTLLLSLALITCAIATIPLRQASTQSTVYTICQASRMGDTITENQCIKAQQAYSVEYLCQHNNKNLDNHCWVEPTDRSN